MSKWSNVHVSTFFMQIVDFLDVIDDDILGYTAPAVITVLHTHLATCAVDYRYHSTHECSSSNIPTNIHLEVNLISLSFLFFRPLYLSLRVLLTAESFSLSSNIIVDTATFHLRYQRIVCSILTKLLWFSFFVRSDCFEIPVRFILDDSALYLSDKCESDTVDLRRGVFLLTSKLHAWDWMCG